MASEPNEGWCMMSDPRQALLARARELLPSWFTDRLAGEPARFSFLLDTRHVLVVDAVTGVRQAANGDVWIDVELVVPFRKDGFPWGHFPVVKTFGAERTPCSINAARIVAVVEVDPWELPPLESSADEG